MVSIMAQYRARPKRGNMQLWRLVKARARYGSEWTIDSALKEAHAEYHTQWLNEERFKDRELYELFVKLMLEQYVTSPDLHAERFSTMNELGVHQHVVPLYKKCEPFRTHLLEKMNSMGDEHAEAIRRELDKHGYT